MSVACGQNGAPATDAAASGFVPVDSRWMLQGEVTTATTPRIFDAASALALPESGIVDCDGVRVVDSTAVALLLAIKRRGNEQKRPISFVNVPVPLMALASVYGVADLLR